MSTSTCCGAFSLNATQNQVSSGLIANQSVNDDTWVSTAIISVRATSVLYAIYLLYFIGCHASNSQKTDVICLTLMLIWIQTDAWSTAQSACINVWLCLSAFIAKHTLLGLLFLKHNNTHKFVNSAAWHRTAKPNESCANIARDLIVS